MARLVFFCTTFLNMCAYYQSLRSNWRRLNAINREPWTVSHVPALWASWGDGRLREESDPPSGYSRRRLNALNRTEPNRTEPKWLPYAINTFMDAKHSQMACDAWYSDWRDRGRGWSDIYYIYIWDLPLSRMSQCEALLRCKALIINKLS